MREKLTRFMMGRYGVDALGKCTLLLSVICILISSFTNIRIFYYLALILLIWGYVRIFSRNIPKRYRENQKYLQLTGRFRGFFLTKKSHYEQRGQYRFYRCPQCSQSIRVPRGHGRIAITCPKCRTEFIKKS